jgi:hypothetical protein
VVIARVRERSLRRGDTFGDVPQFREHGFQGLALGEAHADLAIARQVPGAGEHEVAQAGEAREVSLRPMASPCA